MVFVYFLTVNICILSVTIVAAGFTNSLSSDAPALVWNISASTVSAKKQKTLLNNAVGSAGEGKLHAIMGPSGSGKTTLLNVLAGVVPKKKLLLSGAVDISSDFSPDTIYVQQEDLLFPQLSVIETLDTSAALKFPEIAHRPIVDRLILDLGLKKSSTVRVGDAKSRGISGGEKKRLSIGNELVGHSIAGRLIFADEPTSGLDSYQAERVVQILRNFASNGNTVIVSLHQPRASIIKMFDEITVLSEGLSESSSRERISKFAEVYEKLSKNNYSKNISKSSTSTSITYKSLKNISLLKKIKYNVKKFNLLLQRAWRQVVRDKSLNIARFASSLFSALFFGAIYYKLGLGASTVADRLGLLQVAAVNTAMSALIKSTTSFVSEKFIVQRERRSGSYAVAPYFLSKLIAELPLNAFFPCLTGSIIYKLCGLNPTPGRFFNFLMILTVESMASSSLGMAVGSLATSVDSAIAIAPSVMVIFIVFGGLYLVNAPSYLAWIAKVSLIRWAYEALCVNEMQGLKLIPEKRMGPLAVSKGEQVLDSIGYGSSTVKTALPAFESLKNNRSKDSKDKSSDNINGNNDGLDKEDKEEDSNTVISAQSSRNMIIKSFGLKGKKIF
eukprot:gene4983-9958_t